MSEVNGSTPENEVTSYSVSEQGVALIRLNRPKARNAINTQMLVELLEHLAVARSDEAVRVLVFSSADHLGLSAGADVREESSRYLAAARPQRVTRRAGPTGTPRAAPGKRIRRLEPPTRMSQATAISAPPPTTSP